MTPQGMKKFIVIVMLSVMPSVIWPKEIMPSGIIPCVKMSNVIIISVVKLGHILICKIIISILIAYWHYV
jgi:hypothetical protein